MNSGELRYNVINNNYASAGSFIETIGIALNGLSDEVENNKIIDNGSGSVYLRGAALEFAVPSDGKGIIKNNIIAFNQCAMGVDAAVIDSAPQDYHLRSNSPCIDAGDPSSPFYPETPAGPISARIILISLLE